MEKSELYLIFIEKCFPNVFDFFLKSTAMSKISPSTTDINFPWEFFFWKCSPLIVFFLECDKQSKIKFFLRSFSH